MEALKVMDKLTYLHREIAKQNNLNESTVNHRYYVLGWSAMDCVTKPVQNRNLSQYLKRARENNISDRCFYSRMDRGWSPEDACTKPTTPPVTERMKWREIALSNGISKNTFGTRVHLGWSFEDAATTPVNKKFSSRRDV